MKFIFLFFVDFSFWGCSAAASRGDDFTKRFLRNLPICRTLIFFSLFLGGRNTFPF